MIKCVFFDLDGTLLPMDQEAFVKAYLYGLTAKLAPFGYEPKLLARTIWAGTEAMVRNDGAVSNETVFRKVFRDATGTDMSVHEDVIEAYYRVEFQNVRAVCGFTEEAAEAIRLLKSKGIERVLATNPLFPQAATHSRVRWAGLEPGDFSFITTYENSSLCKPNPEYYRWLLNTLGLRGEECLMVGNDAQEDGVAEKLGMQVFLLTPCLIDRVGDGCNRFAHGGFAELVEWLNKQLAVCE